MLGGPGLARLMGPVVPMAHVELVQQVCNTLCAVTVSCLNTAAVLAVFVLV